MLDAERVFPDDHCAKLLDSIRRPAFADTGDAGVGLDGHDVSALVEDRT